MALLNLRLFSEKLIIHYTHRVFFDIYPLSKQEFAENSIYRRASYDYIVQIVEKASELTVILISTLYPDEPVANTYTKKFLQGKQLKVLPNSLSDALIKLGRLRNKVVHENSEINQTLTAYDQLGSLVIASFSIGELANVFSYYISSKNGTAFSNNIIIDKNYLIDFVGKNNKTDKLYERINTDGSIFTCEIDVSLIKSLTSKIIIKK